MNKDVRIGTNYPHHPKIRKLKKLLGSDGVMSHVFLLCFVAQTCPSGTLKAMDAEDIAQVAQWRGNPEKFVSTLVELRLLDNHGENYTIHNWLRWNLFAASAPKRSEIARANIKKRWEKKEKLIQAHNTDSNTDSNTPSPSPSPSPRRKGEGVEGVDLLAGKSPPSPQTENIFTEEAIEMILLDLNSKYPDNNVSLEAEKCIANDVSYKDLYFALNDTLNFYEPKKHSYSLEAYFKQAIKYRMH